MKYDKLVGRIFHTANELEACSRLIRTLDGQDKLKLPEDLHRARAMLINAAELADRAADIIAEHFEQ